jgi:2-dehydro-3-deoxygluconokinase
MARVASIGECMIELKRSPNGPTRGMYSRAFGGDTLNTAVYLARLGVTVDYITALGDDPMSEEMLASWRDEGVGTTRVARLKGKLPGLYMIETDDKGERRFFHWRDTAAARSLFDLPESEALLQSLASYDLVYLSAVTLSIYTERGRMRLLEALRQLRERGSLIVFDTNLRIRNWPDLATARDAFQQAFTAAGIILASTEDLVPLYPGEDTERLLTHIPGDDEVVLRLSEPASIVRSRGELHRVRAAPLTTPVVDTTAAGDSFSAAYIAARLAGAEPADAARAGHALASVVVCHPGAIIPRSAMPARSDLVKAST